MRCLICNSEMDYFLSKSFNRFGLQDADYCKCPNCGFCASKTHLEMSEAGWGELNVQYHRAYQHLDNNPDDPRWISRLQAQAGVLDDAASLGLIPDDGNGRWLDYACGGGQLSAILKTDYDRTLNNFDRYMPAQPGFLTANEVQPGKFDFVITTSVLEHFTRREHFDQLEALVAPAGVFGIHTLVCENIPKDPDWFYFLPVHCAFHTNKSMTLLFEQWGYRSSVYNVDARLWLWFRDQPVEQIRTIVEAANAREGRPRYLFKEGFMDYWK